MKSVVKGQIVKETYSVVDNLTTITEDGEEKRVFTARPHILAQLEIEDWKDILVVDGEICYNRESACLGWCAEFNISENETVREIRSVFRADLNEKHYFTNKVLETQSVNKEESESKLRILMADFNEQMIESNEQMSAYCKLHKLDPRETDCDELFKILYPGKEYEIVDGKMRERVGCCVVPDQEVAVSSKTLSF